MRRFASYVATGLACVAAYVVYSWGGPVHALGVRHLPGGCAACDNATAQVTVNLVNSAQEAAKAARLPSISPNSTAPVGSAQ